MPERERPAKCLGQASLPPSRGSKAAKMGGLDVLRCEKHPGVRARWNLPVTERQAVFRSLMRSAGLFYTAHRLGDRQADR